MKATYTTLLNEQIAKVNQAVRANDRAFDTANKQGHAFIKFIVENHTLVATQPAAKVKELAKVILAAFEQTVVTQSTRSRWMTEAGYSLRTRGSKATAESKAKVALARDFKALVLAIGAAKARTFLASL